MVDVTYIYVNDNHTLATVCRQLQTYPTVALDTEFARFNTYYQKVGLVQLCGAGNTYLVDPLSINEWQPFKDLMQARQVTKVVHACGEDLELLQHWLDVIPTPLFDTQVAAAYAGYGLTIGLKTMLQILLDIDLDKQETRSDWLQRPLTQAQCQYAATDVAYLFACQDKLHVEIQQYAKLHGQARSEWFYQDMQALTQGKSEVIPDQAYLKVKSAWCLNNGQRVRLQTLAAWREKLARQRDKPRNFIIKDTSLLAIAQRNPNNMLALAQIIDMHPGSLRRYGQELLKLLQELVQDTELHAENTLPKLPPPLTKIEQQSYKQLQQCTKKVAESQSILPQLLVRKADLVEVYERLRQGLDYVTPKVWLGWRAALLDGPVSEFFKQHKI